MIEMIGQTIGAMALGFLALVCFVFSSIFLACLMDAVKVFASRQGRSLRMASSVVLLAMSVASFVAAASLLVMMQDKHGSIRSMLPAIAAASLMAVAGFTGLVVFHKALLKTHRPLLVKPAPDKPFSPQRLAKRR